LSYARSAATIPARRRLLNGNFTVPPAAPVSGRFSEAGRTRKGYSARKTLAAARMVFSMSAGVCAVDRKPASNCDGAK